MTPYTTKFLWPIGGHINRVPPYYFMGFFIVNPTSQERLQIHILLGTSQVHGLSLPFIQIHTHLYLSCFIYHEVFDLYQITLFQIFFPTHLSVLVALSCFQTCKTSCEFQVFLVGMFYHSFCTVPVVSVTIHKPTGSYDQDHLHCYLISSVIYWA